MISDIERRILEYASKNHVVTKGEISRLISRGGNDGTDATLGRLQELGLLGKVESLGTSFVITQKGIRAANESMI